jgi:hypothetical protein
VPALSLRTPVIAAWPSRGSELVTSEAKSEKFAFISDDDMVVLAVNELTTLIVPDPFLAMAVSLCVP